MSPKPMIVLLSGLAGLAMMLPASALDCRKATAPEDKAICADPQALAADDAMTKAYQERAAGLGEADKKILLQSQRAWLKLRTNICAARTGADQSRCLKDETEQRTAYLAGRPEAGPGSGGKLVPVTIEQAGGKNRYELDINVLKYAPATTPAELLFNAQVDKLLKDVPNGADEDFRPDVTYSYQLTLTVPYASPRFISAHYATYLFSGGAHGNSGTGNINIDASKGKLLSFGDLFTEQGEGKINAECLRQILAQKSEKLEGEKIAGEELAQLRASVEDGLKKLENWSFSPGEASVTYDPYAVGTYVEGAYQCEFKKDFLQPFVKTGFTLP